MLLASSGDKKDKLSFLRKRGTATYSMKMQQRKTRKRKQPDLLLATKSAKANTSGLLNLTNEPYPDHPCPTPQECLALRDGLLALHGFPKEFIKYRKQRLLKKKINEDADNGGLVQSEPLECDDDRENDGGDGCEESVLDGLVSTILSQNTTEVNSQRAFASLRAAFPTWEDVVSAKPEDVQNAIKCGGLALTKAACIKNILNHLLETKGKLCLEYLRELSIDEIKTELSNFKGIGPKTVACVLMFHLQQDDFPVDTHIFQIAKTIGWVPDMADIKKTYLHLNKRIPDNLKFDLNCLLYTHGKACKKCSSKKVDYQTNVALAKSCPALLTVENLLSKLS